MSSESGLGSASRRTRLVAVAAVFVLELVLLAIGYQIVATLDCDATSAAGLCSFLGSFIARGTAIIAAFGLILVARPAATRGLLNSIEARSSSSQPWLLLHLVGVALLFLPLAAAEADGSIAFDAALLPWFAGGAAAGVGALLFLAPPQAWLQWGRALGWLPLVAMAGAFFLSDLAKMVQPLWDLSGPSALTFRGVHALLDLFGAAPVADIAAKVVGVNGFNVEIAQACSGVEGVALLLGFATLYALLFRAQLRVARFWLIVVPLGVAASLALNVVRIALLVAIGAYVSPEFALNGFHSYAGWMLFTLLAIALLCCAHSASWLQRDGHMPPRERLRTDRSAACILPFLALMASDVVIATVFPDPVLAYPVRLLIGSAVIGIFWPVYAPLLRGPVDPMAVGAGAVVGLVWLIARSDPPEPDVATATIAGLGGLGFAAWATARIIGTAALVPMVEELFFRGYVLARLDGSGPARRLLAIAVSSAMFGAMHERWLIAFASGVVFALVYLRRNRLADAIAAHVAANLVVAAWALAAGDWAAI